MRLAEVDGKALLRRHGLAVPRSVLLGAGEDPPNEAASWPGFLLKAQLLEGGRGKHGLVRRFDKRRRFPRRAAADPGHSRRRRYAASSRRGGADRARDFRRGAHRRHAAEARAPDRAAGRRECRAIGQARAHSDCGGDNARSDFPGDRQTFSARAGGAAVALCGAAAGNRSPGGSGASGDQSAGADGGRQPHRLRRQDHP